MALTLRKSPTPKKSATQNTVPLDECSESIRTATSTSKHQATHQASYIVHPQNAFIALFIFLVLSASGIALATMVAKELRDTNEREALSLAEDTGIFFSNNLDDAILPLFSLAQFVTELNMFQSLSKQVGIAGTPGSLPFVDSSGDVPTHRNVSGVCDEPALVDRFEKIASTIKTNSKMDGILVNLQLVPDAVVCLLHPMNNTEDFPPGVFMDNSGALGHDLLNDPERKFIAEATVPADDVVIAGPLTLKQCQDCDPTVEKAFIARLPIASANNTIVVNDVGYNRWGFVVALINWNELVARSGVYEVFESEGMEFQLTRTDRKYVAEEDRFTESVVTLAESAQFQSSHGEEVSTTLPTTNNEWEITVVYCIDGCITWFPWVMTVIILSSLLVAALAYTVFSQKQKHSDALAEKQAQIISHATGAAQKEREFNDFIAHEVRNPLSAALSACSFVSSSVNEKEPLVNQESRDFVRDDVRIIESSLHFINDLLRSMLDLHRAKSNQLTLTLAPTDIKRDILDPVASMLYQRDALFKVEVECKENLIVSVDRLRLKQVILNLSRNSTKFVEKGFIRLRAELKEPCGLCIYVEDSGPGIPLSKREKLFSRFQDSLDELSQGTGIGLSLCKKLVDLMEGSIVLDDSYHSGISGMPGAKLIIQIKCEVSKMDGDDDDLNSATASNTSRDEEKGGSMLPASTTKTVCDNSTSSGSDNATIPDHLRVMFVDDDVVLRKLFFRSLKRIRPNWTLKEAASGESAITIAEEETFDIIFMDQYMMSVDKQLLGTETVRKLRSMGVDCLICGLSANDMEEPFIGAGADAFMIKPFPCKPDALTQELLRILKKKEAVN